MRAVGLTVLLSLAGCAEEVRPLSDQDRVALVARWEEAAAEGDADAQFQLAYRTFLDGDRTSAVAEFERLGADGHLDAVGMAAAAYQHGWGVDVDYGRSAYWLERGAALGSERSARDLAAYRAHKEAGAE